jgi:hypothetical protein
MDKNDIKSAKVYLDNVRNLQKTERDIFEAKKQKNDLAIQRGTIGDNVKPEDVPIIDTNIILKDKETNDILVEAENLNQRSKLQQKQLNIKEEDLTDSMKEDNKKIQEIDSLLNNKSTIKDSLNAGFECVVRSING